VIDCASHALSFEIFHYSFRLFHFSAISHRPLYDSRHLLIVTESQQAMIEPAIDDYRQYIIEQFLHKMTDYIG